MILSKLVVGDEISMRPNYNLRHCPAKPMTQQQQNNDGGEHWVGQRRRYDTVTGTAKSSKIYVVYENGRAYPEYLVTYST